MHHVMPPKKVPNSDFDVLQSLLGSVLHPQVELHVVDNAVRQQPLLVLAAGLDARQPIVATDEEGHSIQEFPVGVLVALGLAQENAVRVRLEEGLVLHDRGSAAFIENDSFMLQAFEAGQAREETLVVSGIVGRPQF